MPSNRSLWQLGLVLTLWSLVVTQSAMATPPLSAGPSLAEICQSTPAPNVSELPGRGVPPLVLAGSAPGLCPEVWTPCNAEICQACCYEWGGWTGSLCTANRRDCLCWDQ